LRDLKYIQQPKDSKLCGQACLAMVTGKSLKQIIALVGHSGGTRSSDLIYVLRKLGYKTPNRLLVLSKIPNYAIAKIPHKNVKGYPKNASNWHWVVYWNGERYDPYWESPSFCAEALPSSFLPIVFNNLKNH
jgi:hypothetical protein